MVDCPAGSRGAAFLFGDDAGDGAVSVVLAPAGSVNQANPPWAGLPANTVHELRNTAGGRLLIVVSQPQSTDGDAPFGDQMPKVAADLAAEF